MAQTTTNYGLYKPESTDSYNHLIYDNPNMDTIDAAMKANADASVVSATCIKSGTTHTITRSNTNGNVFKFTATGDWNTGDTMIVDGVTVSPYLVTGEALKTGAYLINTEVLAAISGTRVTIFSNQSEAGTTFFDDSTVSYTANNVQDAIEEASTADGTEYVSGVSVKQKITSLLTSRQVSLTTSGAGNVVIPLATIPDPENSIVYEAHCTSRTGVVCLPFYQTNNWYVKCISFADLSPIASETLTIAVAYAEI